MKLTAREICERFDLEMVGDDKPVIHFSIPEDQKENTVLWVKDKSIYRSIKTGILIAPAEFKGEESDGVTYLYCQKSPRLIFARILNTFFGHLIYDDLKNHVEFYRQDQSIQIGDNCFIAANVKIGKGTTIFPNTSIFSGTVIGENCQINANCSISTIGLGFEYDGDEIVKFPQIGGVIIGNNVEIGPNSTVRRGALGNTIIKNDCKIGSLSNIGHNTVIGEQSILTTQCVVGGSSVIGDKVFMGINAITRNKIKVGNNVNIGMGSVITKDIPDNVVVYGNPAQVIRPNHA